MFDVGSRADTIRERFRRKLSERPGKPVDGARLLRALGRRKAWIVGSVAVGIVAGLLIPYGIISHDWTATAVVEWEGGKEASSSDAVRDLLTLVDEVKLPTHLDDVRQELGLDMSRNELGSMLEVSFDRDSNVVAVNAVADDPEKSARIANAVVDTFLDHQSELAGVRSAENVEQLRTEVAAARESLDEAQADYDRFRRQHGISDLSLERQHAIEMAAELQSEAQLAQAEAMSEQQRAEALRQRIASGQVPRSALRSSPALRAARNELQQAQVTLSEAHPRVRALQARVTQLEEQLTGSGRSGGAGSALARRASRASNQADERHETYDSLVRQARERLAQLSEVEGEASQLLSRVRVKEAALAEREGVLARAHAEATTASSGFRLLAAALPPEEPSSSNRRAMAVFILLGIVGLTIGALLLWELRGLRAHTANEVAFWGRAPVLAATQWPREKRSLGPVIEELGDYALESGGTTLVLAASEAQAELASEVAQRLHLDTDVAVGEDNVYVEPEAAAVDPRAASAAAAASASASASAAAAGAAGAAPRGGARVTQAFYSRPAGDVLDVGEGGAMSTPAGQRADSVQHAIVPVSRGNGNGNGNGHHRAGFGAPLARRAEDWMPPQIAAWRGALAGSPMRRAARVADRVIVVVPSGGLSFGELERLRQTLGRENDDGIGYLIVDMRPELSGLPDRAGPVDDFWRARRA